MKLKTPVTGLVRMSSKGQIVVPKDIREALHLKKADEFVVYGKAGVLVFKKVTRPKISWSTFDKLVAESHKRFKEAGYTEEMFHELIGEAVRESRKAR